MERNELIQMRVSPSEKKDMIAKSKSVGMGISTWLRKLALEWKNK